MAYNTFYPQYYQPYYQPIQPIYQPQITAQTQQTANTKTENTQPQIQNGGFIPVPSEEVARNYPVANGVSVTFKNENAPYVYTKTKGFSQLEQPIFEKYRLVKEDSAEDAPEPQTDAKPEKSYDDMFDDINGKISQIQDDINDIRKDIDMLKDVPKKANTTKKRDDGDV